MIPILYEKTETTFTSNGLGRLTDCLRCIVTEERNGIYECEFDYPISGDKYSLIEEGRIIAATHDDNGDIQPFDIYHRTAPINGIVTFYARHISYRQIGITVKPFTASGVANAIAGIKTNSLGTNPFTYTTNKTTTGTYKVSVPSSAKALLGGEENSLLDVFGVGEYEFDKFNVKLWTRRGSDKDVEIRYGKNLVDIEHDVDYSESYNGIVPYWFGKVVSDPENEGDPQTETEVLVTLPEWSIMTSGTTYDGRNTILPLDLSGEFDEPPTESALRTLATSKLNEANTLLPIDNLTVNFVQLWQTDEYKGIAPLQAVGLCDTVNVIFPELGVNKTAVKVIKTVYNTLLDRYDEMELGDRLSSYASIITANNTSAIAQLEDGLLIVSGAANQAQIDAGTAHDAAISAAADAADAASAASRAQGSADAAALAASNAQNAADNAQRDATAANKAANGALSSLSVVEDVLGVLNWVSEHGTYAATTDTEVVPGKFYFTRSGSSPNYTYTVVLNPSGNPSTQNYYELTGTDEAVSQYVSSHLALTNAGLYVINDNNSYKILLASDGMYVYDELGALVSKFGQSITFSDTRPQTIGNASNYIKFYDSDNNGVEDSIEIAGSNVNIASGVTIGGKAQADYLNSNIQVGGRNLSLKTATESVVTLSAGNYWFLPSFGFVSDYGKALLADTNNTRFTVSFDYEATGLTGTATLRMLLRYTSGGSYSIGTIISGSNPSLPSGSSSGHAEITFAPNSGHRTYGDRWMVMCQNTTAEKDAVANATITISNFKFEIGTKATDWTPAPEDTINENLLIDSQKMYGWTLGSMASLDTSNDFGELTLTESSTLDWNAMATSKPTLPASILDGTPLWLSFEYKASANLSGVYVNLSGASNVPYSQGWTRTKFKRLMTSLAAAASWTRVTVACPSTVAGLTSTEGTGIVNSIAVQFYNHTASTTLQIRKVKLEHGISASDWTNGIEDYKANITSIDSNGIWVTPPSKRPTDTSTGAGATGARINSDGMEVFKGGTSVAKYGDTARIGKESSSHIEVSNNDVRILNNGQDENVLILEATEILMSNNVGGPVFRVDPNYVYPDGEDRLYDYVIDSGEDSGWKYRLWNYGTLEMWGTFTDSTAANTSDGGGYRTSGVTPSAFPFTFDSIPIVNCNIRAGSVVLTPVCISNPSTTSAGKWAGYRANSNSNTSAKTFMFHVIGTIAEN